MKKVKMEQVKRSERGWAGHFICASRCLFRRNTLLEYGKAKVVVSTVGLMLQRDNDRRFDKIGLNQYYETMAFLSKENDLKYHDADVEREVFFSSQSQIDQLDADDEANLMHENIITEISELLLSDKLRISANNGWKHYPI